MQHIFFLGLIILVVNFSACEKSTLAKCPVLCSNNNLQHIKRVLLIGIDGCRSDALQAANTPNLDQLMNDGRYSFVLNRGNQYTWSGAGWSTMLTGVWPDKHGIYDNSYADNNYGAYPHLFCRIKEYSGCLQVASIVHYSAINYEITSRCNTDVLLDYDEDKQVKDATINYLNDCNLDIVFAHFDDVDHAGHQNGFHPSIWQYRQAIEQVDIYLEGILQAVYEREKSNNEDWLIIVSSDHGGKIDGRHGGGQYNNDPEVTRVFGIFRTKNTANKGLMTYDPNLVDVVPTILEHLSIPIDPIWDLDGVKVDL